MSGNLAKTAWRFLIRMDVVAILILLILLLLPLGSCFPQRPLNLESDSERLELWDSSLYARYGSVAGLLESIGLFRFFDSPIFIAALSVLILSTLICTLDRWGAVWRKAFHYEVICPQATYHTAENQLKLKADPDLPLVQISNYLIEHGYRTKMEKVGQTIYFRGDINRFSESATLLTHVGILLLICGALLSAGLGWRKEIVMSPGMPMTVPYAENIELYYDDFAIQRYPDGSASAFVLRVLVKEKGREPFIAGIKLNQPLVINGVSILLQGYSQVGEDTLVSLLMVHDPGYLLVILAGLTLLCGMVLTFYFPHRCIYARAEPDGVVSLAGRADRRAYSFSHQFEAIVRGFEDEGLHRVDG